MDVKSHHSEKEVHYKMKRIVVNYLVKRGFQNIKTEYYFPIIENLQKGIRIDIYTEMDGKKYAFECMKFSESTLKYVKKNPEKKYLIGTSRKQFITECFLKIKRIEKHTDMIPVLVLTKDFGYDEIQNISKVTNIWFVDTDKEVVEEVFIKTKNNNNQ